MLPPQVAVAHVPSHVLWQPPPAHVKLHVAPARHFWMHPPPEHEEVHVLPDSHVTMQPPPAHVELHVWPAEQGNWQPPDTHVGSPDASTPVDVTPGVLQSQRHPVANARAM